MMIIRIKEKMHCDLIFFFVTQFRMKTVMYSKYAFMPQINKLFFACIPFNVKCCKTNIKICIVFAVSEVKCSRKTCDFTCNLLLWYVLIILQQTPSLLKYINQYLIVPFTCLKFEWLHPYLQQEGSNVNSFYTI